LVERGDEQKMALATIYFTTFKSPLGKMIAAASNDNLAGLWFDDGKHIPDMRDWKEIKSHPILDQTQKEIELYFKGDIKQFSIPMKAEWGTEFQRSVWNALKDIDSGSTLTYSDIAAKIGKPTAVRPVSTAIGHNPWTIVVPCHRVVGKGGSLTGYAGGLHRKEALLRLEGVELPSKKKSKKEA
jgi:methylated-DNA-[protein]-cysteine S-methyltransferase